MVNYKYYLIYSDQDPNEDTEWNDILRSKGILPPKPKEKEITEDDIVNLVEQTIKEKQSKGNSVPCLQLHFVSKCKSKRLNLDLHLFQKSILI